MSASKTAVCTLTFGVAFLFSSLASAQERYVYLVNNSDRVALTGFRVRGTKGIITALHGVVGARTIKAYTATGDKLFEPLRLQKVDIASDIALLWSPELDIMPADGFEVATNVNWATLKTVKVVGYPIKMDLKDITTSMEVRETPMEKLTLLLNKDTRSRLVRRKSPDPAIEVLSLQGFLNPGHSGAPVLNSAGQLVAVGNGGLQLGTGLGWAIPFGRIRWERALNNEQLAALTTSDMADLFATNDNPRDLQDEVKKVRDAIDGILARDPDSILFREAPPEQQRAVYEVTVEPGDARVIVELLPDGPVVSDSLQQPTDVGTGVTIKTRGRYRLVAIEPNGRWTYRMSAWFVGGREPHTCTITPTAGNRERISLQVQPKGGTMNVNQFKAERLLRKKYYPDKTFVGDRLQEFRR